MDALTSPLDDDTWVGLSDRPLPLGDAAAWAVRPDCGALVLFSGTARDTTPGRPGLDTVGAEQIGPDTFRVHRLDYEAYEEHVVPALRSVAEQARQRWPVIGRVALLHRVGTLDIGEAAVVVAVSAPHRPEAFEAARFCIDTLKQTVPIWKRESFAGGELWGAAGP
jgi:molybdopterin synthase catalytic subunit